MQPGLVSLVVASYNHARFLPRRMESLLAQTYPDIEIIVIDDGSPDDSVAVLRGYADDPRVRLIVREENGGWVAVSNQGLDLARGEFVLFANCDDECEPQMVERLVAAMRQHPSAGIAFCRSAMIDAEGRFLGDDFEIREPAFRTRCGADTLLSGAEASRFLLRSCVIPNLSAALFRTTCFAKAGRLSSAYRVCCDWDLFFRIAASYDIAYIAEPLNGFRQHAKTIRSSTRERVVYDEYFRLLLARIRVLDLTATERVRFRTHVMYLWAVHLSVSGFAALGNFPSHFARVVQTDPMALVFFLPGLGLRLGEIVRKATVRVFRC